MITSQAISDFQKSCHEYYACYVAASLGLSSIANKIASPNPNRSANLYFVEGHPDEGNSRAVMNMGEFIDKSMRNSNFSCAIAGAFVVAIYSEWSELYRNKCATELGVSTKDVKSDLMGDLRIIRNYIVHDDSKVPNECAKLKTLGWNLEPGKLRITGPMFSMLIDQINHLIVRLEAE